MELIDRLSHIETAIKQLQSERSDLLDKTQRLEEELSRYQELIKQKDEQINNLEEQNKITKLAEGLSGSADRQQLKVQLDELIEEIDQCLNLVKK